MAISLRKPTHCPSDAALYTVRPGDRMYKIARNYNVDLNQLIAANPHIPHPNMIIPGDVLCVPKTRFSSFCSVLRPANERFATAAGSVLVSRTPAYEKSVSIMAILPTLKDLGATYKQYQAYLIYTTEADRRALNKPLYKVPETPNTWATTIDLTKEDIAEISNGVRVVVSATVTESPEPPPGDLIILEGTINLDK